MRPDRIYPSVDWQFSFIIFTVEIELYKWIDNR